MFAPSLLDPAAVAATKSALEEYADALTSNFATHITAQPEDQLKPPVAKLVADVGAAIGRAVTCRTEVKIDGLAGRPDFGVAVDRLLIGNIELKAPGKGAHADRYTGRDSEQFERYKALPNLVYTDGREWSIFRSGQTQSSLRLSFDPTLDGQAGVTDQDASQLLDLLASLLQWQPIVPGNPSALAAMLAPLTRVLRDEVLVDVREGGPLADLAREWRGVFYPEANDQTFADAYAQTLTYALLLAKLEGARSPLSAGSAARALSSRHALLAQVLKILSQQEAQDAIGMPVELLERIVDAVDPRALARGGRDPWLYFYEDFLSAYDPAQRNSRGVYFTPLPVVRAQVRLAEGVLAGAFGKPDAFADADVVVLDPAAGTGTYPLEVITRTLANVEARFGPGALPEAANSLAATLHAFELLVGPYAVSHLRLSRALSTAGATLPATGANVYLTDTLAGPVGDEFVRQAPLFEKPLAREAVRASVVKMRVRVVCCMGNPPYERDESQLARGGRRHGGIVRYDANGNEPGLLRDYLEPLTRLRIGQYAKSLYNDYVYFWRWSIWKVFEQNADTAGIVTLITANSYLTGKAFSGMREHLRRVCDELWIVDLGGEGRGSRIEQNVFDILTPVAIAVAIRYGDVRVDRASTPAVARYQRITGTRDEKYQALNALPRLDPTNPEWQALSSGWNDRFVPDSTGDFSAWCALDDIFPWRDTGSHFYRTWPIGETKPLLTERWERLVSAPVTDRPSLLKESRDRHADRPYRDISSGRRLLPIAVLNSTATPSSIERYGWRTLDREWCIRDNRVADYPRPQLWRVASDRQLYLQTLMMSPLGEGPAASVFAYVPDCHAFRGSYGDKGVFPLWRNAGATTPNISAGLLDALTVVCGRTIEAEDLFAYVYGLLGTSAYTERFEAELGTEAPRIPITEDPELFTEIVKLGRDLIWWHTYGERFVPSGESFGRLPPGSARNTVAVGHALPDRVSYDAATDVLTVGTGQFEPVSSEQWEFQVSGYKVVQAWLAHRKKKRAGRSSSPLDSVRPSQWEHSAEFVTLLSIVEHTLAVTPDARVLLEAVISGPVIDCATLPKPIDEQRTPPEMDTAQIGIP